MPAGRPRPADRYARRLETDLSTRKSQTLRAASAKEGIRLFVARASRLGGLVPYISTESKPAGLGLFHYARPGEPAVRSPHRLRLLGRYRRATTFSGR